MNSAKHNSPQAVAFASALLDLAEERNQLEPVGQELRDIAEAIASDRTLRTFFNDPSISTSERDDVIQRALAPQVSKLVADFLRVVNSRNSLKSIASISSAYDELLDEKLGKVEVDISVAQKLEPDALEAVRQKVSGALKREAVIHQYVDPDIIGGLVLRVGDKLIDGSVRHQLESIRGQLLAARTRKSTTA